MRWIGRIILAVAVGIAMIPFLVWGHVFLLFYLEAKDNERSRAHRDLQARYASAFNQAREVQLLEAAKGDFAADEIASATMEIAWRYPAEDATATSRERREISIRAARQGEEECARLVKEIASKCRVVEAKSDSENPIRLVMQLEFTTSGQPAPSGVIRSSAVDALRLVYTDVRAGEDGTDREMIYARIAANCRGTRITVGRCTIKKLNLRTEFLLNSDGPERTVTKGHADVLVVRNAAPTS